MLILRNKHLTVGISTLGAEMQSILDANGVERLWQGDPTYWTGRAPVLFPVAGGLKEDTYTLDGVRYHLGKHGFARNREFSVEHQDETSATLLLTGNNGYDPGFPFPYAFRIRYTLLDNAIRIDYQTDNLGDQPFWYGVGAHEAYACDEGIEAYEVVFEKPEKLERGILRGGCLTRETELVMDDCTTLPIRPALFANDTQVYQTLASRSVTLQSPLHGRSVRVDFEDFDYLLLWTKPGAGYLCIEPWSNLPDYADTDHDITQKPGMTRLLPGETRTHTHTVAFNG